MKTRLERLAEEVDEMQDTEERRRDEMVDNRYSGVGYEPPAECADCADLRRQLEEARAAIEHILDNSESYMTVEILAQQALEAKGGIDGWPDHS